MRGAEVDFSVQSMSEVPLNQYLSIKKPHLPASYRLVHRLQLTIILFIHSCGDYLLLKVTFSSGP